MLEIVRIRSLLGFTMFAVVDCESGDEVVRFDYYFDAVDFIRCLEGL